MLRSRQHTYLYLVLSLLHKSVISSESPSFEDLTPFVDVFIGSEGPVPNQAFNGGNVFPGASMPFGAVKVGIDTTEFNASTDANAGYTPDGNVTAITMLHESGTGGGPTYGFIPQMPLTTLDGVNLMDNLTYMQPRTQRDSATVGHYTTNLANGVEAQFSASMHAGLLRYTYPQAGRRLLMVDLSHYLPTQDEIVTEQFYSNGLLDVSDDRTMYSGYGVYRGGWNEGPDHTVYFCAQFDTPASTAQLFYGPYTDPYWPNSTNASPTFINGTHITGGASGWNSADRIGALFEFPSNVTTVNSKVGVSWISTDRACQFLEEIPQFDMNSTVAAVRNAWNEQVLNKIHIEDKSNLTRLEMFYSAMYHSHLLPSNRTGESPYWEPEGPYFDDFYTFWDTFRCLNSLYLLIEPDVAEAIVRTLIDVWRYERFMPDARSANYNGRVQGGSNADNVLADAYVKGLRGGINWTDGYMAMLTDAEVTPYNTFDAEDLTQSTKEGRGALPDWLQYGYVTPLFGRSISKTVEYSLNDFSVATVAKGIAPQDEAKYMNRSAGWQKIWRNDVTSLNFTGFLAPIYGNGTMQPYDPLSCGSCEWQAICYEALPWEYSWTVPFDMQTLIKFVGGPNTTEKRLDTMFIPNLSTGTVGSGGTNGIGTTIFNPGNEPSFATPFLYNYLQGRQWKSVLRSRQTVNQYYSNERNGLPGNSDAGAIDSWLIWNMLGMYPIVTQPIYLLLSPWFDNITMSVGGNKTLQITSQGLSNESYYVQSVQVNGQAWNKSWVTHEDLVGGNGGKIEFQLGSKPVEWDTGELPPSPGHVELEL